ncbi:MAG: MoaD/ThiS family protein [Stellaceae bacterium]
MIEVTVTMHGNLRRFLPEGRASTTLRVPEGTTLRQVIEMVHAHDHVWLVAVNGTAASAAATVSAGDAVDLYEQLEGG